MCEGHVARILHAELSSKVLMEPACQLANCVDNRITSFHSQVHREDTDRRSPPRLDFTFLLFKQKRRCTQSLSGLLR